MHTILFFSKSSEAPERFCMTYQQDSYAVGKKIVP
jgi:hypothetical protein